LKTKINETRGKVEEDEEVLVGIKHSEVRLFIYLILIYHVFFLSEFIYHVGATSVSTSLLNLGNV